MAKFDPKNPPASSGDEYSIPPGDYVIAMTSFERRKGKDSGKPYLRTKFTVVCGAAKGKSFYASQSLDTSNGGAMKRLELMCECVGQTEAFDLDSDRDIESCLAFRPFKARVARKTANGYTNNDIERYLTDGMSAAEERAANAWVLDQQEERDGHGSAPSKGSSGKSSPQDFADDDIPFATCEADDADMRLHDPCRMARIG